MTPKRRHRRPTYWIVRGGLVALALILVATVGLWLAFERIPAWYAPVEVSQAELTRVRNSLPNTYQAISDQVVRGAPFDLAISERTVTEWVVARGELYPEAQTWLPDWLRDPVVCFRDGRCIVGARIDYRGWRTILGIHLICNVTDDAVTVRLDKVTAGAVAVPLTWLSGPLADLLDAHRLDATLLPDPIAKVIANLRARGPSTLIDEGATWPNQFEMRNGRRQVTIKHVRAGDGSLVLRLESR